MTDGTRGVAVDAVVWISGALAAGSALLAVGHAGVRIPVVSALGPGGSEPVVPAAIVFTAAACLHGAVTYGVVRHRPWSWPLGVPVAAVTLIGAAVPFRGVGSAIGIALAGTELALLLTGRIRRAILHPAS